MSVHQASPNSGDVAVTWMCCPISSEEKCALIQSTTVIGGCLETFPGIGSGSLDSYVPFGFLETDSDDSKCRPCDPYIILRFRREYRVELEPTIFFREKDLSHTTSL